MIRKLLIAIPCYDALRAEFVESLLALMKRLTADGIAHDVKIISGTVVHTARDNLARYAVNNGFSHALWLDDDMVFGDSILDDLTVSGKTDQILCARFVSRHNPYLPTIYKNVTPDWDRFDEDQIPEETFRIAACGFACVLTPVQCLGDVLNNNRGHAFHPMERSSEDLSFCLRATGLGYEIWCEPTARVGHIGSVVIWPEDGKRIRGDVENMERLKTKA